MKKNLMIIVAAPSGAGKSSFVEKLASENSQIHDVITYTTRSMRNGESQGHPYFFLSKSDFEEKIKNQFFIEWAQVHTNLYGTSLEQLEMAWSQNKAVIMDVDIQGAATFKAKFPEFVKTIFILPPSIDELRRRVIKRDGGAPADLEIRMQNAEKEMQKASEFDVQIVNDEFDRSFQEFKMLVEGWMNERGH